MSPAEPAPIPANHVTPRAYVRRDHEALALARLAEDIAEQLPAYLQHAAANYHAADGQPAGDNGEPNVTRSQSTATSTETAALTRAAIQRRVTRARQTITECRQQLSTLMDELHEDARRENLKHGDILKTPRCDASGRDGYLIPRTEDGWAELDCRNIPRNGKTGLCNGCGQRERRWRIDHNLPTDGRYHAPAA